MTKNEELNFLLEIFKKYDLPLSPILEYVIKSKMDEPQGDNKSISRADSVSFKDEITQKVETYNVTETRRLDADERVNVECGAPIIDKVRKNKKKTILRVTRKDGYTIEESKATETLARTIQEIGVERVRALNISLDGMNLILIGENTLYPSQQYYLGDGYYLNTHSSTDRKKYHLEKIFKALGLEWKVEIVSSEY